jgi:hypothetical protein
MNFQRNGNSQRHNRASGSLATAVTEAVAQAKVYVA